MIRLPNKILEAISLVLLKAGGGCFRLSQQRVSSARRMGNTLGWSSRRGDHLGTAGVAIVTPVYRLFGGLQTFHLQQRRLRQCRQPLHRPMDKEEEDKTRRDLRKRCDLSLFLETLVEAFPKLILLPIALLCARWQKISTSSFSAHYATEMRTFLGIPTDIFRCNCDIKNIYLRIPKQKCGD